MFRWLLLAIACFGLAISDLHGEAVVVYTLDGAKISGSLLECGDSQLKIETQAGKVEFAFRVLDRLEVAAALGSGESRESNSTAASSSEIATLVDGSRIRCREFTGSDDRWTAKSVLDKNSESERTWEFPKGSIESLFFGAPTASLKKEWEKTIAESRSSDEMIIARPGDSIDRASGMVVSITPETVEFSFDGQILQAPRKKLLGLFWYRPQEKRVEPAIQIQTRDGSIWEVSEVKLSESTKEFTGGLRWKTPSGVGNVASWNEIAGINFAAANVVWLAAQPPLSSKSSQRSLLEKNIAGRENLLGPRFYTADTMKTSEATKTSEAKSQDLLFSGPGEITFRVPEGFKRFVSKVRRFEKTRYATTVNCKVWVGDTLAWEANMDPEQIEAVVDFPVVSGQRLRMVVACDSELMLGTQLSWLQPRLTR